VIRLFVALPVPLPVADQLAALVPAELKGLKRVGPELMHVTLAFIGWLDESRVAQVTRAVEPAAQAGRAFEVPLGAVGRFPPTGRPRVIWVGTGAAQERILALGDLVRDALAEASIPFDIKPLRPHITLARVREDVDVQDARAIGSAVARAKVPEGLRFRAGAVNVMQSVLTPKGPRYSSLRECPLE
jgi:RNA 2',3'-cyclic 3'-phosphodiesterase